MVWGHSSGSVSTGFLFPNWTPRLPRDILSRMESVGRGMVIAGLALACVGALVWWLGPRLGHGDGLLPGDISFRRGSFSVHFPIVTCLVVSVVLTVLMRLFRQ